MTNDAEVKKNQHITHMITNVLNVQLKQLYRLTSFLSEINNKEKEKQLIPKTWSGITALNRWQHMARAHS